MVFFHESPHEENHEIKILGPGLGPDKSKILDPDPGVLEGLYKRKKNFKLALLLISFSETRQNQFIDRGRIEISVPLSYILADCTVLTFSRVELPITRLVFGL